MVLMILVTLYPFWHALMASFSDSNLLLRHTGALFVPEGLSFSAYDHVLHNQRIFSGYFNTLFVVVIGTVLMAGPCGSACCGEVALILTASGIKLPVQQVLVLMDLLPHLLPFSVEADLRKQTILLYEVFKKRAAIESISMFKRWLGVAHNKQMAENVSMYKHAQCLLRLSS